ncbi:MAG: TraR/DksA C4-type zinc finger protein [Actinobacteria bacterium]|nr:TraR/DksA C4-type zinc finger protein [Actinomycetota bacterium]
MSQDRDKVTKPKGIRREPVDEGSGQVGRGRRLTEVSGKVAPVRKNAAAKGKSVPLASKGVEDDTGAESIHEDKQFLEEQRQLLLEERAVYMGQASDLKAEAELLVEEMEPGDIQFDEESGEGGTTTIDRERDLALSEQALAAVAEIDHALAKIDQGTYGKCEQCGQPIPKARLKALPYARLCVPCKSGGLSRR